MYEQLIQRFRDKASRYNFEGKVGLARDYINAADSLEELLKAAKAMHTWIFLNSGDEQATYDECGLTDEMNAALGYGGRYIVEPPREEREDADS